MNNRIKYKLHNGNHVISLKMVRRWNIILFLTIFTLIWFISELLVVLTIIINLLESEPFDISLFIWLSGWSLAGFYIIKLWLWNTFGKEVVVIEDKLIKIRKEYGLIKGKMSLLSKESVEFDFTGKYGINIRKENLNGEEGAIKLITKKNTSVVGHCLTYNEAELLKKMLLDLIHNPTSFCLNSYFSSYNSSNYNKSNINTEKINIRSEEFHLNRLLFFIPFILIALFIGSRVFPMIIANIKHGFFQLGSIILFIWGSFFIISLLIALFNISWSIFGYEQIWVKNNRLHISKKVFGISIPKIYNINYVKSISFMKARMKKLYLQIMDRYLIARISLIKLYLIIKIKKKHLGPI
ncbi:MAG: hypothetical protein ACOC1K_06045 [Nanoarchaeota archaeon]